MPEMTAPFWQVQSVFDPDGGGADFAYTIGLHTKGLPELHVWARPSLGEDPGDDWMLSNSDRCRLLNELAQSLVDGQLSIGSTVEQEYDDGVVRATFRVDPPGDKELLEAFGVPDGVDVLPVLWSLRRPAEGELTELAPAARREASRLRGDIRGGFAGLEWRGGLPHAWALDEPPDFDPGQSYGPLTPIVFARAAEILTADDATLARLVRVGAGVGYWGFTNEPAATAAALARPVGRRKALDCVHGLGHDLVTWISHDRKERPWWPVLRAVDPELWDTADSESRVAIEENLGKAFHDVVVSCLAVEAVADVAPSALLLRGRGPWTLGMRGGDTVQYPDWHASAGVLSAVRAELAALSTRNLMRVVTAFDSATRELSEADEDYAAVCSRLLAWASVSAASCPRSLVRDLPSCNHVAGLGLWPAAALVEWATCLTSAITNRAHMSARDVETFASLHRREMPHLADLLNRPI